MRQILDEIHPIQIERVHHRLMRRVEQAGVLKNYDFFPDWKLVLLDGVEHFHSHKVHCVHCRTRHYQDGSVSYNHAMLASVLAHPDKKEVLPLCEEAITNEDGQPMGLMAVVIMITILSRFVLLSVRLANV